MTHKDSANYSKGKLAVGYGVIAYVDCWKIKRVSRHRYFGRYSRDKNG